MRRSMTGSNSPAAADSSLPNGPEPSGTGVRDSTRPNREGRPATRSAFCHAVETAKDSALLCAGARAVRQRSPHSYRTRRPRTEIPGRAGCRRSMPRPGPPRRRPPGRPDATGRHRPGVHLPGARASLTSCPQPRSGHCHPPGNGPTSTLPGPPPDHGFAEITLLARGQPNSLSPLATPAAALLAHLTPPHHHTHLTSTDSLRLIHPAIANPSTITGFRNDH